MLAAMKQLTNINEYYHEDYVNMACTGPEGTPCPYSGIRQAMWVYHDNHVLGCLCRSCGDDVAATLT